MHRRGARIRRTYGLRRRTQSAIWHVFSGLRLVKSACDFGSGETSKCNKAQQTPLKDGEDPTSLIHPSVNGFNFAEDLARVVVSDESRPIDEHSVSDNTLLLDLPDLLKTSPRSSSVPLQRKGDQDCTVAAPAGVGGRGGVG